MFLYISIGAAVAVIAGILLAVCTKKAEDVTYTKLDKAGRITMSGDELVYQIYLYIPAITAFTVAASIALRRVRYTKAGFFVQFIGPVLFALPLISELDFI